MLDQKLDCIVDSAENALPLHIVRPDGLAAWLATLPAEQAAFLRGLGLTGARGELHVLPGTDGIAGAVLGLGSDRSPFPFGALPTRLPAGTTWRLQTGDYAPENAVLGFCLGAYRFERFKKSTNERVRLLAPEEMGSALSQAAATWMVRDLINTPANLLGPAELANLAADLGRRHGASVEVVHGEALDRDFPTVAAVGRGSDRKPRVTTFRWRGTKATDASPLVSLCGKGVCFDTGGYDLKPSAGMLRMKKDMGGAATVLGLARMIMDADLPVRLVTRVGCVENSVSGDAMRPSDVITTRSGKTVEIGNTDAEGRLVLCDLLHAASEEAPTILIDCATLTGAARVALGPDLPALFCNDDAWADAIHDACRDVHDPLWRLPLWDGYDDWIASPIADMNNVSSKSFAGSIVAGLFLRRFVGPNIAWAHIDMYAWNDQTRPGRPEGGEAQTMRGLFAALNKRLAF